MLRRRVSEQARGRHVADQERAAGYPELLGQARAVERELRQAQYEARRYAEIRQHNQALVAALAEALEAAEAGERAAMGPATYDDHIARRKALARPGVRWWTDEADRLRTLREAYRLEAMGRTGTLVPSHVQVGTYAVLGPHIAGVDMAGARVEGDDPGRPGIGVDLDRRVGEERP